MRARARARARARVRVKVRACEQSASSILLRKCGGLRQPLARAAILRSVDRLKRITEDPSGERQTTCLAASRSGRVTVT